MWRWNVRTAPPPRIPCVDLVAGRRCAAQMACGPLPPPSRCVTNHRDARVREGLNHKGEGRSPVWLPLRVGVPAERWRGSPTATGADALRTRPLRATETESLWGLIKHVARGVLATTLFCRRDNPRREACFDNDGGCLEGPARCGFLPTPPTRQRFASWSSPLVCRV